MNLAISITKTLMELKKSHLLDLPVFGKSYVENHKGV